MRAWVALGLVGGLAVVCVADPPRIELYATRGSEFQAISAPYTFDVTARDFRPDFNGFGGTPVSVIDTSCGAVADTLYVWGRFVEVPDYTQLRSLNLVAEATGGVGPIGENAMYRHRVVGANPWRRWDGTQPLRFTDPEGTPAVAVAANGIVNWTPQDMTVDLFDTAARRFLIGALEIQAPANATGVLTICEGSEGGVELYPNPLPIEIPPVRLDVTFVPEPALCGVVLLSSLVLRRRRRLVAAV